VIGCAVDLRRNTVWFTRNGVGLGTYMKGESGVGVC